MLSLVVAMAVAQVAAAPMAQVNLGTLVLGAVGALLSLLTAALIWFVKRLIASFDKIGGSIGEMRTDLQTVKHELFGPFGKNGMRGELRAVARTVKRHSRLLAAIAHEDPDSVELDDDERDGAGR